MLVLFGARIAGAQSPGILVGRVLDSAGTGVSALITVRSPADNGAEIAKGTAGADGSFRFPLTALPARVLVEASTSSGLVGRAEVDSVSVRGSIDRPIMIRLGRAAVLKPVEVRGRYQRRPSVFSFFEGEPSTRIESTGPTTVEWLDPFAVGGIGALLNASPDLLVAADGTSSVMGAPGSSNQLQIGGVRVPSELISGQLGGNIAISPWDVSIGGAAGATVNLFVGPASRYRASHIILRSGIGGVPRWVSSAAQTPGVSVPARVAGGTTGPIGRFGYRANIFLSRDLTPLPRWDQRLDEAQRAVLDSVASVLSAPAIRENARTLQAGAIGRLDLVPFDNKRVLALTSALTRSARTGGTGGGFLTGSVGTELVDYVALLQLESTRILAERVLWTSMLSTSWTKDDLNRTAVGPTIIATDAGAGGVLVTGGAPPQSTRSVYAAEARSTGTWYSINNRVRYVAQLQTRLERAHVGGQAAHSTFSVESIGALRSGEAFSLVRENGSGAASASSIVFAPAASARIDVGESGSLLLGVRADGWTTNGVAVSGMTRYADVSPRIGFLHQLGTRSANRGPIATLRIGAGRFTDWPSVQQWSDAWSGGGASREVCVGDNVPPIVLTSEAPFCASNGTIGAIGRPIAARDLRPTAANRVDLSVAIAQVAPGVRGEIGIALAQTTRIAARLSPLASVPVADRLSGEGDRALLVPATTIGAGGLVPLAPIPDGFSNATRLVSDGRSSATQWRARLTSRDPFARTKWNAAYTLTTGRERSLAVASPTSAPGFVSGPLAAGGRHTFALSAGSWIGDAEIRLAGIARSGIRFTPLADRDLNGDGRINDAVFVPQSESDLLARTVSPNARSCILAAAGRIAAVNSCTGPWSISSLFLASIPGARLGLRRGSAVELQISNPLAAVVGGIAQRRVTFGEVTGVERALLHVTGFDSNARRFTGVPLSNFGAPVGFSPRITDPVRLALGIRVPLGPSVTSQRAELALRMLQRDSSARARQGAAMQYFSDLPPIPMVVLQSGEGIQLTSDQRRGLQALAGRWQTSAARIVTSSLANDGHTGDATRTQERLIKARVLFLTEVLAIAADIRNLLSADQIELLPDGVQRMLNPRFLRFLAEQDAGMF
ncbi:MAG TPA: hypothetical protein VNJ04_02760 [Gemmatimonadaceae bacterium]|nr:hypothetical protein [Gemmatimonadaceae bacterium]